MERFGAALQRREFAEKILNLPAAATPHAGSN